MAPVPVPRPNTITHFIHPGHQLSLQNTGAEYICNGCKTTGTGVRFRCQPCDFDMHEYCATCPMTLSSFMHPHPLNLVQRKPQPSRTIQRICNVCREDVVALFYRCSGCEFDVHPLCTQLPTTLRHPLHLHPLTFQSLGSGWCAVCSRTCDSWRYRCLPCGIDIHLGCILDSSNHRSTNPPSFNHHQAPSAYGGFLGQPPMYGGGGFQGSPPPPYGGGFHVPPPAYQFNRSEESTENNGGKTSMFSLVGKLAFGVLNNVDLSSFIT